MSVTIANNISEGTSMTDQEQMQIISVPMNAMLSSQERQEAIDVRNLSQGELGALKKQDPFLYHSIPAAHRAALCLESGDISKAIESGPAIVYRKSRITTECHHSVLLEEDILGDDAFFEVEGEEYALDSYDDLLDLALLLRRVSTRADSNSMSDHKGKQ